MDSTFVFGTVGSPISTPKKPGGSVGAILHLHSLGLSAFELGWVQSVRVSEDTCRLIRETAQNSQTALSVHAPYYINLNATDEEWQKSRKRLFDAAYYGALAGATDIVFHPGSYFGMEISDVMSKSIDRLRDVSKELSDLNIDVTLRPETMGKSAMIGSLEDTLEMSQVVPNVKPCLDFAHLHARPGDGSINTEKEWDKIFDAYQQALGSESLRHLHIHLSGIEYTAKGEKNHLPIQESDLDLKALYSSMHKFGCGGRILCESPILEEDALFLKQSWINNQ
ncbi:MAG: TIM barrel protein [Anaerolineae bacterium]|nr:TIM barrel protein [Anaerolineae bacterium]